MTEDFDFKRLVRERMARTGETYTAAHAVLRPDPSSPRPPVDPVDPVDEPESTIAFRGARTLADDTGHVEDTAGFTEDTDGFTEDTDEGDRNGASLAAFLDVDPTLTVDDLILGDLTVDQALAMYSVGVTP